MSNETHAQNGIEPLEPMYLAADFLATSGRIAQQKVFRINIGAGRHYRNEHGDTFKSITTFLDDVMPENKFLKKWRESKIEDLGSVDAARDFVQSTADFGTALHIAVADYCRNGFVDWNDFNNFAFNHFIGMGLSEHTLHSAIDELTKDFASMLAFFHEYDVRVIAVEIPVFSSDGFATLIDLVCEMNAKSYTEKTSPENRKRIIAGINLKSGKKGFHLAHQLQLIGERKAFNETYSATCGFEMVEVYNIAPTDWRNKPTFTVKRQTDHVASLMRRFELYVLLGIDMGVLGAPTKSFNIFNGVTKYGEDPAKNMVVLSYDEMTRRRLDPSVVHDEQETKEWDYPYTKMTFTETTFPENVSAK